MKTRKMRTFVRFAEKSSSAETNHLCWELAHLLALRSTPGHPIREAVLGKDVMRVLSLEPPRELNAGDCYIVGQVQALFKKREDLDLGVDREAAAFRKFKEAETLNESTREIFNLRRDNLLSFRPRVESVLHSAQRKIAKILGDVPSLDQLDFRFGPGATTSTKKKDAHPAFKLGQRLECSEALWPHRFTFLAEMPGWELDTYASNPVFIGCGKLGFVPKNWKTFRGVVTEPVLNGFGQLGIGDYLKRRLLRFGVDLEHGQALNGAAAKHGSIFGDLATLDLSSASDTVSSALVEDLFPLDWVELLSKFRTPLVRYKGALIRQEKFSSMGNGYTFPLESLIFFALACAAAEEVGAFRGDVLVYGDDIIVPTASYELLTEVLCVCGFLANSEKSFAYGPFRESCGEDYYLGENVRPIFIDDALTTQSLFVLHNQFVRRGDAELAGHLLSYVGGNLRRFGPDGFGDGHLLGEWDPVPCKRDWGYGGYTFQSYVAVSPKGRQARAISALALYTIYRRPHPREGPEFRYVGWGHVIEVPKDTAGEVPASWRYTDDGVLEYTIPGIQQYRLTRLYTFARP